MAGPLDVLHIGYSGVSASNYGIRTTGDNITNVNTPGFHRRELILGAASPSLAAGRLSLGMGVSPDRVQRVIDSLLLGRLRETRSDAAAADARSSVLIRADAAFGDLRGQGMSPALDKLLGSFDSLAARPEDRLVRSQLVVDAERFAAEVSGRARDLRQIREGLNTNVQASVNEINAMTAEIASINRSVKGQSAPPNDLLDRREALIDQLADQVDIRVIDNGDGTVDVHMTSGFALVLDERSRTLTTQLGVDNLLRVLGTESGVQRDLTGSIEGGSLGGTLRARDVDISSTLQALDQFAFDFANAVNAVHTAGFGLDGVGGRNLFVPPAGGPGTAEALSVDPGVAGNPDFVAAALNPLLLPGDNANALALAGVRNNPMVPGGSTPADGLRQLLTDFADRSRTSADEVIATAATSQQLSEIRDSVSGVNLDEEMVGLIKFRQSYNAAAQVLRTADEMLSEIIALKR